MRYGSRLDWPPRALRLSSPPDLSLARAPSIHPFFPSCVLSPPPDPIPLWTNQTRAPYPLPPSPPENPPLASPPQQRAHAEQPRTTRPRLHGGEAERESPPRALKGGGGKSRRRRAPRNLKYLENNDARILPKTHPIDSHTHTTTHARNAHTHTHIPAARSKRGAGERGEGETPPPPTPTAATAAAESCLSFFSGSRPRPPPLPLWLDPNYLC